MTTVVVAWLAMLLPVASHGYGPAVADDIGVALAPGGVKTWQISEGRDRWHHVVQYWWMQISGQSLMMSIDDLEARKIDLATLPAHLRPKSLDDALVVSRNRLANAGADVLGSLEAADREFGHHLPR
jgi:hypothetical protein